MAPGLEEEVVEQVMSETDDREYIQEKMEALRELGFKINDKKVESAIKRYELLQEYNSQNNNRRNIKKKMKERFDRLTQEEIESAKNEDSSIIDGKVRDSLNSKDNCPLCGRHFRDYSIKLERIKKSPTGQYITTFKDKPFKNRYFQYCWTCGTVGE